MTRQRALTYIHIAAVLFGLTGVFGELIQAGAVVITMAAPSSPSPRWACSPACAAARCWAR